MLRGAALALAVLLLGGCQSAAPDPAAEHPLVGTTWRAREIDGRMALAEPASTLSFESRERVAGQAGCNRFFGRLDLDAGRLALGQMGSTRMACAAPVMEQERRFLLALQASAFWEREGDTLRLLDGERRLRLRLTR
ncbi:MAG TPA: META domain-containing protein [Methylomirabilota bacterium]|nr:META domain-containing protein [Methylomirabilota bacterium]